MYQRQIPRAPKKITRDVFIDMIFELGKTYEYGYDTIMGAIELADKFMLIIEPRTSYHEHIKVKHKYRIHDRYKGQMDFLIAPIEQYYSPELVVVTLTLAGKSNEDDAHSISYALTFVENYYIIKMEWEVANCFGYYIRVKNIITDIGLIIGENADLASIFGEIAQDVCRIPKWWTISSVTIIMATLYLYQNNKLHAVTVDKVKRFRNFIKVMAEETETSTSTVLDTYINISNV